MLDRLSAYN